VIARLRLPDAVALFDSGIAEDGSFYDACGVPKIALDAATVCDRSCRAPTERIQHTLE
jgi:hypothetical protein